MNALGYAFDLLLLDLHLTFLFRGASFNGFRREIKPTNHLYIGNLYIFTLNLVSPFRKVRLKSRANRLCIFCVMRTHYGHCYVLKQCQVNISRHFITLFFLFRWNCCRRKQSIYKRRTLASNGLSFRNATRVLHKNVFKRAGYLRKFIFLKCLGRSLKMLNCLL